jgi:hypothetical protein
VELPYVRIYVDASGESHFEDAVMPLATADLAPPMRPVAVSAPLPAARLLHLQAPQELDANAWHTAPKRQFFYLLKGWVEITVSDGETRRLEPGDILLVEDTHGKGHAARRPDPDGYTAVLVQLE